MPSAGGPAIRSTLHKFLPFLAENGVRECRFWRKIPGLHSVNILLTFPWRVGWVFCCHPRLGHWLLSRALVEEHSASGVFSILCCTAGLQWDRQENRLVTMETSPEEWEQYTTGVKEKLEIILGLEKARQRKWALFRSAAQQGRIMWDGDWGHKLVSVYLQAGGLVLQIFLLAPK